ncbi:MAG: UDP-N-acetylmuramoyl-L-alanine--D-glutamate ligase, partial [Clostridia bacterium]|nr:UDP-N-acetylmuramoyl-L-alanine--D-glutamate ligase [Clostridia bacterium]
NVVILGFGAEGKSTYEYIKKYSVGASITIADQNEISGDYDAKFCCGENYQSAIYDADIVMKSPGVVLDELPPEQMEKITSQIELFLEKHRDRVIGITGTKGKSTTASLIYHVLHSVYPDTLFAGNIGLPALDIMPLVKKNGYIVLELSSHQTEYIKVSPKYSAILNFFEEHLDHYGSYEKYIEAKKNIYKYQQPSDIFFCEKSNKSIDNVPSNRYTVGGDVKIWGQKITFEGTSITVDANKVPIKGKHNLSNIAFAFGICSKLGITPEQFENALYTFEPLPHRMEYVGEYGGVKYYNDSIATIPEACMNAVRSIPAVDTLILGGMDRGIDYTELCKFLNKSQISNVIIMPDTDKVIAPMLTKVKNVHTVSSLEEAVEIAKKVTPMGKTCLLSPAASSYNMFKNFAERGNKFKELVKK